VEVSEKSGLGKEHLKATPRWEKLNEAWGSFKVFANKRKRRLGGENAERKGGECKNSGG